MRWIYEFLRLFVDVDRKDVVVWCEGCFLILGYGLDDLDKGERKFLSLFFYFILILKMESNVRKNLVI